MPKHKLSPFLSFILDFFTLVGLLLFIWMMLAITSCNSSARLAKKCAIRFPVQTHVVEKETYLPGKPVPVPGPTKYLQVNCDSAINATQRGQTAGQPTGGQDRIFYFPLPADSMRVDTLKQTREALQESTAKLEAKDNELDACRQAQLKQQSALGKAQSRASLYGWAFLILGCYTALRICARIWLPGLAKLLP